MYLGRYEADRSYKKQVFPLSTIAWIRYLKVVWISHYDDRYYCTMTRLQVFGSTSIKEFMTKNSIGGNEYLPLEENSNENSMDAHSSGIEKMEGIE